MDTTNSTLEVGDQEFPDAANFRKQHDGINLNRSNRRLLLGATLRLLVRRFGHGQPIFQDDVIRAASLADDAMERAA